MAFEESAICSRCASRSGIVAGAVLMKLTIRGFCLGEGSCQ